MFKIRHRHAWSVSPQQAIEIQQQLRNLVINDDQFDTIHYVVGTDVGFENNGKTARAAVVVLEYPELVLCESTIAKVPTSFPYIPGLLSFRELPAVLEALNQLKHKPDLILCDGQGYAHQRGFGIACHLGVLIDVPTIGVGKTRLVGTHAPVENIFGAWQPLEYKKEIVGAVLRSRINVKPIYVSVGHRVSLSSAVQFVMSCTKRYKLPETTRLAHHYASRTSAML